MCSGPATANQDERKHTTEVSIKQDNHTFSEPASEATRERLLRLRTAGVGELIGESSFAVGLLLGKTNEGTTDFLAGTVTAAAVHVASCCSTS